MANENYEGFDLTIYNLFTLLREMYYTRGETETNFLSKSGGTLGGSLTIQGNLTVQGNSYKIDTEDLVVKDYTITLAKDNEQALLSMVGMVVPKYDGTNYGFFGWDADGYAYVGDLDNWDGSSAITLAENTSLQKIATIKDTATGTTSDDIMVYDQTNKVFKKAPSGRYVIEDNELVASNDNNALYNLGAFDTISGNTITRQTGIIILDEQNWNYLTDYDRPRYEITLSSAVLPSDNDGMPLLVCNNYEVKTPNTAWSDKSGVSLDPNAKLIVYGTTKPSGKLEYKLSSTYQYQDTIIENQPLLNLDSNGCNFLREEWEKGLNLLDNSMTIQNYGIDSSNGNVVSASGYYYIDNVQLKPNTTYSLAQDSSIYEYSSNMTYLGRKNGTFTTSSNATYFRFECQTSITTTPMLNSGTHAYPYEEYNGAIVREKDIEPVLLWENPSPNNALASGGITTGDMSKYKYIEIVYKYSVSSGYSKCVFKAVYEASTTFFISSANAQQYGELIVSRGFTFTNSTTLTADKGTKISIGSSSPADDNNKIVPIAIYGTNVL